MVNEIEFLGCSFHIQDYNSNSSLNLHPPNLLYVFQAPQSCGISQFLTTNIIYLPSYAYIDTYIFIYSYTHMSSYTYIHIAID